jgi:hypothetical protein
MKSEIAGTELKDRTCNNDVWGMRPGRLTGCQNRTRKSEGTRSLAFRHLSSRVKQRIPVALIHLR